MNKTTALVCAFSLGLSYRTASAERTKTVFNPFTGKSDYITRIDTNTIVPGSGTSISCTAGACTITATGGGGASNLAIFSGQGIQISSPTPLMNFEPRDFSASLAGAATAYVFLNAGTTDFVHNQNSLQSGTTLYISSATVDSTGWLTINVPSGNTTQSSMRFIGKNFTNGDALLDYYSDPVTLFGRMRVTNLNNSSPADKRTTAGWNFQDGATGKTSVSMQFNPQGSNVVLYATGTLKMYDGPNAHFVALQASQTIAADKTFILPSADGTSGQALTTDGSGNLSFTTLSGSGGGGSSLEVMANSVRVSSPTASINAVGNAAVTIAGALTGGATAQLSFSANPSSVTLQGPVVSSITLAAMYGAPTLAGTNFTSLPGAQVGSGVPAANIASGSLGANVIASSFPVSGVAAGSYTNSNITVSAQGIVTAASNGSAGSGGIVSPGTFTWTNQQGLIVSTLTAGSATDTSLGNAAWVTINSSGSSEGLIVNINGNPSGGYQNQLGAITTKALTVAGPPATHLVIVDSTTDSQKGLGLVEIWSDNPLHNDPKLWFHVSGADSSPEIRDDANAPNWEMINTSTDNSKGLGKWEPAAMANRGTTLQINSRAWDNSTFETVAEWNKLSAGINDNLGPPGLYLHSQTLDNDSGIISSSDTAQVRFFGLTGSIVGLTGPLYPTLSYAFALPSTIGAQGEILFHNGARGKNFNARQMDWSGTDFTYSSSAGVTISTLTSVGVHISSNVVLPGTTVYADGTLAATRIQWSDGTVQVSSPSAGGSGAVTLTGDVTGSGTGTVATTAAQVQANIRTFVSSITVTNEVSLGSTTLHNSLFTPSSSQTSSYAMTCADQVIFAASSAASISTVTLPAANCASGQLVSIYKVDTTTTAVIIIPAGSDTITGFTKVSLATYGMADEFISDGVSTWYPHGKLHHPPAFMGNNQDIASASALVASTTYHQAWNLDEPCDVRNVNFNIGNGTGKMAVAIYDEFGKLIVSSGPVAIPGTGTRSLAVPKTNLRPGLYYLAFGFDNATATVTRYASNLVASGVTSGMYSKTLGMDATTGIPIASLGNPPVFENNSTRSPAVIWGCYNGAP